MSRLLCVLFLTIVSASCGSQSDDSQIPAGSGNQVAARPVPGIPVTYNPSDGFYSVNLTVDGKLIEKVGIDTGSSNLILLGGSQLCSSCVNQPVVTSSSTTGTSTSNSDSSPTFTPLSSPLASGKTFSVRFGIGSGEVQLYKARVGFQGIDTSIDYPLGVYLSGTSIYNILGLGYSANVVGLNGVTPQPFLDEYASKNNLSDLFTLNLCPVDSNRSFMTIGTIPDIGNDKIIYTPIIPNLHRNPPERDLYNVAPIALWIEGESKPLATFPSQEEGYFTFVDSGTSSMYLPNEMIREIGAYYEAKLGIPSGFWVRSSTSTITIPGSLKDQIKDFQIEFPAVGGGTFKVNISPKTFTFSVGTAEKPEFISILGSEFPLNMNGSVRGIILGQIFMQNAFSVFDKTNNKLGFAPNASLCGTAP